MYSFLLPQGREITKHSQVTRAQTQKFYNVYSRICAGLLNFFQEGVREKDIFLRELCQ